MTDPGAFAHLDMDSARNSGRLLADLAVMVMAGDRNGVDLILSGLSREELERQLLLAAASIAVRQRGFE